MAYSSLRCFQNLRSSGGKSLLDDDHDDHSDESQQLLVPKIGSRNSSSCNATHSISSNRLNVRQLLCRKDTSLDHDEHYHHHHHHHHSSRWMNNRHHAATEAAVEPDTSEERIANMWFLDQTSHVATTPRRSNRGQHQSIRRDTMMVSPAEREKKKVDALLVRARHVTPPAYNPKMMRNKQLRKKKGQPRQTVAENTFLNRLLDDDADSDSDASSSVNQHLHLPMNKIGVDKNSCGASSPDSGNVLSSSMDQLDKSMKTQLGVRSPLASSFPPPEQTSRGRQPRVMENRMDRARTRSLSSERSDCSAIEVLSCSSSSSIFSIAGALRNVSRASTEDDDQQGQSQNASTTMDDIMSLLDVTRSVAAEEEESLLTEETDAVEDESSLLNLSSASVRDDLLRYQQESITQEKHPADPLSMFSNDTQAPEDYDKAVRPSPYPILGTLPNNYRVLVPPLIEALRGFLPNQDYNYWLRFSTATTTRNVSMQSLLAKIHDSSDTIICIQAADGSVFGSFTRSPWRPQKGWYGDCNDGSFLFRSITGGRNNINVYPNTGNDNLVQYCSVHAMAVGGGDWKNNNNDSSHKKMHGGIGLLIDGDLAGGESNSCATFANPRLFHGEPHQYDNEFLVDKMEVWTLTSNKPNATSDTRRTVRRMYI